MAVLDVASLVAGRKYRIIYKRETQKYMREAVMQYLGESTLDRQSTVWSARPTAGTQNLPNSWIIGIYPIAADVRCYLGKLLPLDHTEQSDEINYARSQTTVEAVASIDLTPTVQGTVRIWRMMFETSTSKADKDAIEADIIRIFSNLMICSPYEQWPTGEATIQRWRDRLTELDKPAKEAAKE